MGGNGSSEGCTIEIKCEPGTGKITGTVKFAAAEKVESSRAQPRKVFWSKHLEKKGKGQR